jgi:HK97 family phage major capsid protein
MTNLTKERRDELVATARAVCAKATAEKRDLTAEEQKSVNDALTEIKSINEALVADARSKDILGQLNGMVPQEQLSPSGAFLGAPTDGKRLTFTAKMVADAAAKMVPNGIDAKAVAPSGSVLVGQEFSPSPIAMGKPANTFLAALPVRAHSVPTWKYMRQSVRTNNAAVVAEGAVKPTSVYSLNEVDGSLAVIAHLSEAMPRYWLVDNDSVQQWLTNELIYGLQLAIEAKALADVNGTSGLQTQAYSTSVLETLRRSITKVEVAGYTPEYFLLHPTDWQDLELLVLAEGFEFKSLPIDPTTRKLFGLPVIVSLAQTAGVSHTVASGSVSVDTDTQGVQIAWSETSNSDDWSKNLIRARCEGRWATSVFTPMGIVKGDLTEA